MYSLHLWLHKYLNVEYITFNVDMTWLECFVWGVSLETHENKVLLFSQI